MVEGKHVHWGPAVIPAVPGDGNPGRALGRTVVCIRRSGSAFPKDHQVMETEPAWAGLGLDTV